MDTRILGGLLGLLAGAAVAEEAEGMPAVKGFARAYERAVMDGDKRMLFAGTLEPDVFQKVVRREPSVHQNRVFVGPHAGEARYGTGEMSPLEVGQHIENLLNSAETQVMPNFPTRNFQNNAGGMFFLKDGERDVVSPFMGGRKGDVVLKTVFQPTGKNKKFIEDFLGVPPLSISGLRDKVPASTQTLGFSVDRKSSGEGYLGRPLSPISGLRNDVPASAQPPGLSAVRQPSEESIAEISAPNKGKLPALAGSSTGLGLASAPSKAQGMSEEPGLESPWFDPVDILLAPVGVTGRGARAAAMALEPAVSAGVAGLLGLFGRGD